MKKYTTVNDTITSVMHKNTVMSGLGPLVIDVPVDVINTKQVDNTRYTGEKLRAIRAEATNHKGEPRR